MICKSLPIDRMVKCLTFLGGSNLLNYDTTQSPFFSSEVRGNGGQNLAGEGGSTGKGRNFFFAFCLKVDFCIILFLTGHWFYLHGTKPFVSKLNSVAANLQILFSVLYTE